MASVPSSRPSRLPDRRALAPAAAPSTSAPPPESGSPPLLETLVRIVRRRKWWVIQALVLVPLVVGILSMLQQKQYTATANLLFRNVAANVLADSTGTASANTDPTRDATTNAGLIELPVIAKRAAAIVGGGVTVDRVLKDISVTPNPDSDLVAIQAKDPSPTVAARIANAYGDAYITFRQRSDRQQLQQAIDLARTRLAQLPPDQLNGAPGANLRDQLNRLLLAQSLLTGNAELVQPAAPPKQPSSPKIKRNVLLGLLLGAVLGFGLGGIRERFDQTVRDEHELEELYGVPVLARVARSRKLGAPQLSELEHSLESEAFHVLRANLRYFDVDGGLRSLLISSPQSGDGKSTLALALATAMASVGDRVVLVEADLRKPSYATPDGGVPHAGLSSVLSGESLEDALVRVPVDAADATSTRYLTLLPNGPVPPNPLELLESRRMQALLTELEHRFDLVVFDSPALSHVSDARPLVPMVSGILIVSAIGHTTRPAAVDFRKQLELLEGRPLGVVENLAPTQQRGYYGYY